MMSTGVAFFSILSCLPVTVSIKMSINRCDEYEYSGFGEIRLMVTYL
jgi:hypothetical protein